MPAYEYSALEQADDIRLIKLLQGPSDDEIHIEIHHSALRVPIPHPPPPGFLTEEELRRALPKGWWVHETENNGAFIFDNGKREEMSWTHPNCDIHRSQYCHREDYPYPWFEPKYEALSYTWGPPQKTDCVAVLTPSGLRALDIGHSLAVALRHLRYQDEPRTLWIDAICINQTDLEEQSKQVGRMGVIYKMAHRVVVWLGPESDDSKIACETISKLGSQVVRTKDNYWFAAPACSEPDWYMRKTRLPFTDLQWGSLDHLLERDWFGRLWIWQEIKLANHRAIIQCGMNEVEWTPFRAALAALCQKHHLPLSSLRRRLNASLHLLNPFSPSMIDKLLGESRRLNCSDAKDKVYAILGLVDPQFASKIRPQYSSSVAEVYTNTFLSYVDFSSSLSLLGRCSVSTWKHGLPTWVPNWARLLGRRGFPRFYFACGRSSSYSRFTSPGTLEVTGTICGTVNRVHRWSGNDFEDLIETSGLRQIAAESRYVTGEPLLDAIVSTLVISKTTERLANSSEYYSLGTIRDEFLHTSSSRKRSGGAGKLSEFFLSDSASYARGRVLFETSAGHIGLGSEEMVSGKESRCEIRIPGLAS